MKAVEDGLRRLDGVDRVHTDLQANIVSIVPRRDVALPLRGVPDAIARAGFRPGRMWLEAEGGAEAIDGRPGFRIRGWPTALRVDAAQPVTAGRLKAAVLEDGSLRPE